MALIVLLLAGCTATQPPSRSLQHLQADTSSPSGEIPELVSALPILPQPLVKPKQETYTVIVSAVPARELLFSVARDAKVNVDIHPQISGTVTLNAVSQTLPQILDRIAKQMSLRYHMDGTTLVIEPDLPYWRNYTVDYVNMARESTGEVGVATEISTAGGSVAGGGTTSSGNLSNTRVKNISNNNFWALIEKNILSIVGGAATSAETTATPVVVNPASSIITVLATDSQQRQVQSFLDQILVSALRQVLIEMTIVEVELNDHYQAGVDWQQLASGNNSVSLVSNMTGSNLASPPAFLLNYQNSTGSGRSYAMTLKMLETFGNVKVLSSPKIMALNNQTALLKVVDEKVYFTVDLQTTEATPTTPERNIYTSEIHTVPVGLVMSVTPQINDVDSISLNIRPTISRITGYAIDPAPRLAKSSFDNLIPEIQVREME
ncbi:MAG: Type II secretory pathway component PulD, partial [Halothiobacillaceae bacterium]